jgi:hypothetical protein
MGLFKKIGRSVSRGVVNVGKAVAQTAGAAAKPYINEIASAGKAVGSAVSKEGRELLQGIKHGDVSRITGVIGRAGGSLDDIGRAVSKSKVFGTLNTMSGGALGAITAPVLNEMETIGKGFDKANNMGKFLANPTKKGLDDLVANSALPPQLQKQYQQASKAVDSVQAVRKVAQGGNPLQATRLALDTLDKQGLIKGDAKRAYDTGKQQAELVRDVSNQLRIGTPQSVRSAVEKIGDERLARVANPIIDAVESKDIRDLGKIF